VERLIIDGNNVLHAHPAYRDLLGEDFEAARARSASELAGFASGRRGVVVVFDGGGEAAMRSAPHRIGALTVLFSSAGSSADAVIEALASRCRSRGEPAVVVTSDTETRRAVASGPVSVRSAAAFVEELVADAQERAERRSTGGRRVTVAERVPADIAAVLAGWARGRPPRRR
jgi:hypothetical protein